MRRPSRTWGSCIHAVHTPSTTGSAHPPFILTAKGLVGGPHLGASLASAGPVSPCVSWGAACVCASGWSSCAACGSSSISTSSIALSPSSGCNTTKTETRPRSFLNRLSHPSPAESQLRNGGKAADDWRLPRVQAVPQMLPTLRSSAVMWPGVFSQSCSMRSRASCVHPCTLRAAHLCPHTKHAQREAPTQRMPSALDSGKLSDAL